MFMVVTMLEIERKYRIDDADAVRTALHNLQAEPLGTQIEMDDYYQAPDRDYEYTDEVLRIRTADSTTKFTYKGPKQAGSVKIREEVELEIVSPGTGRASAEAFLELLRYRPIATVTKTRESFRLNIADCQLTVTLDTLDGIGTFAEIEAIGEINDIGPLEMHIHALAERLSLHEVEHRSYLAMVLQQKGIGV